ncbi:MAG: AzlC family ABC transporter permease [Chloroflexota bacterium]
MKDVYQDVIAGARAMTPILLGVVPFAMVTGVAAVSVGLTPVEAVGMSAIVYAGAAQLAVLQLMSSGGIWIVMVLTAWIINLRFTMYSASLAPYLQKLSLRWKGLYAYILSDQAFAVSISRFNDDEPAHPQWFYFGAASSMWATWQVSTVAGVILGAQIPKSWGLDFAVPLTFMVLMFPALKDRLSVIAALVGGGVAVLAKGLPYNLGLVLAALMGIAAGLIAENIVNKKRTGS